MRKMIREQVAEFFLSDAFPSEVGQPREQVSLDNVINYLLGMLNEYEENGYTNIMCECKSDWDQPDWLVITGERKETREENQARIDKERAAQAKKIYEKQKRIRELERELDELRKS